MELSFEIDKITESIELAQTGERFETVISPVKEQDLIENAPFNIGKNKLYQGVCANLVAYGCKLSVEYGFEGYLSFEAKTTLIEHYEKSLGAINIGGQRMIVDKTSAFELISKYFPNREAV